MLIRKSADIRSSEITDEKLYRNRRKFLRTSASALLAAAAGTLLYDKLLAAPSHVADDPTITPKGPYDTDEKLTPLKDVTSYNNFYEFGTDKEDPSLNASTLRPSPWKVSVEGLVKKPAQYGVEELIKSFTLEDRIYRI